MIDQLLEIISKISLTQLSILFLLGFALFGGSLGGRLFQKIRIPQVVGYIIVGVLIGQTGLKIVDSHIIETLQPFNYFALGLIGFMIGGELKKTTLQKYGKQFLFILISEGMSAFAVVTIFVVAIAYIFLKDIKIAWAIGLLLGAIASATAPAATTDVLWEYRSRGPLTTTVLGIVALDDGLSLMLFSIASSIAASLNGIVGGSVVYTLFHPFYEIGGSILLGVLSGLLLSHILKRCTDEARILALSLGTLLLVLGLAIISKMDILMASMALGVMITNYRPRKSKEILQLVGRFTPPVYVLFFVLFGAKLNISNMTWFVGLMAVIYLLGRTGGKMFGAALGARLSNAPRVIQKYLPFCLFSQAGVAIGLSILVGQRFPGPIGDAIVVIITATTFVVQIIGPTFVKSAITRAGEVGLNITEEDLIRQTRAKDIMQKDTPLIYENMPLNKILKIFSSHANIFYPVVDASKKLVGIMTIDTIKNTFMTRGLDDFLLAHDLMEPVLAEATPDTYMSEVKEMLDSYHMEYLPVVDETKKVVGFLESRAIKRLISQKIVEIQKHSESLEQVETTGE